MVNFYSLPDINAFRGQTSDLNLKFTQKKLFGDQRRITDFIFWAKCWPKFKDMFHFLAPQFQSSFTFLRFFAKKCEILSIFFTKICLFRMKLSIFRGKMMKIWGHSIQKSPKSGTSRFSCKGRESNCPFFDTPLLKSLYQNNAAVYHLLKAVSLTFQPNIFCVHIRHKNAPLNKIHVKPFILTTRSLSSLCKCERVFFAKAQNHRFFAPNVS